MGFKFGGAGSGALKGAAAGSPFGPIGMGIGGLLGGVTGGFSKDIDKKVTGNSGSGTTNNLLNIAGLVGGGASLLKGGNPFSGMSNPFKSSTAYAATAVAPNMFSGSTSAGPGTNVGFGRSLPQQSSQKSGGFGGFNPLTLGAGIMGASQLIKSPQVPQLPQSVIDFQNAARSGNPLQNQAASALSQQLGQTQQNLGQPEIDAINRQYDLAQEQELKSVDSMYKSLRPGTDPLTDTAYQKDLGNIRNRYATLRSDSVAQAQRQISNDFSNQRVQQIAQAAGLGQQQLQQLASLGQYDLDRQLQQLSITDRDRQTLRDYLLQFGGNLASSQLDPSKALEMQLYQKLLSGGK